MKYGIWDPNNQLGGTPSVPNALGGERLTFTGQLAQHNGASDADTCDIPESDDKATRDIVEQCLECQRSRREAAKALSHGLWGPFPSL